MQALRLTWLCGAHAVGSTAVDGLATAAAGALRSFLHGVADSPMAVLLLDGMEGLRVAARSRLRRQHYYFLT